MEHGKPYGFHEVFHGIPTVREGDDSEGRGCWKKRMPRCNDVDRGYYNERIIYSGEYPI